MKTYVKPDLYYEDFELSNSVAGGCVDALNHTQDTCSYDLGEKLGDSVTIFSSSACDVDFNVAEGEDYCYYTGTDDMKIHLFTS